MAAYICFITVLIPSYKDKITSLLINSGFTIGPTESGRIDYNRDKDINNKDANPPSSLLIYKLEKNNLSCEAINVELEHILTKNKIFFHSIIISEIINAAWSGANFVFPINEKLLVSDNKKNNLN